MTATTTATSTGDAALNVAMTAGFEVTRHGADHQRGMYVHVMTHPDGRTLSLYRALGNGRFCNAQGYDRPKWNTTTLSARSIPALQRLLSA